MALLPALLELVLDEIDCVDDFGPESDDPGGDSQTCPGGRSSAVKHPGKVDGDRLSRFEGWMFPSGAKGRQVRGLGRGVDCVGEVFGED